MFNRFAVVVGLCLMLPQFAVNITKFNNYNDCKSEMSKAYNDLSYVSRECNKRHLN